MPSPHEMLMIAGGVVVTAIVFGGGNTLMRFLRGRRSKPQDKL